MVETPLLKLHPGFEQWLSSEKAPNGDFNAMLVDILENLLPHFEYNQFDIAIDADTRLEFDNTDKVLWIKDDPQRRDLSKNSGNCVDLATKAYLLICIKYPILKKHLVLFDASESNYFDNGAHKVLVFADIVTINGRPMSDFETDYHDSSRLLINGGAAIIDPSFRRAVGIYDSHYHLNRPCVLGDSGDLPLGSLPIVVPLALTRNGTHVFFGVNTECTDLYVVFKDPGKHPYDADYDDPIVSEILANDPEITENLALLRSTFRKSFQSDTDIFCG